MKTQGLFVASLTIAAAMAAFALVTADHLGPGATLPTHWNAAGEVDGHMEALAALLFPAGVVVVLAALFAVLPRIEPMQERMEASAPLLRSAWLGTLFILLVVEAAIGLPAWGVVLPVNAIIFAVGVLFVVLGNALPKSRPGFFVGIRTPWTISDTDTWIATHRLGGKLMLAAGLVVALASLAPLAPETLSIIVLASLALGALLPVLYSWWYWNRRKGSA